MAGVDDLTPWELEVARELALYNYREAAENLSMNERTLRYHAQKIMDKIGAKNKAHINRILHSENLI